MSAIANSNQPEDKPKTSRVQSYWRNIPWKKLTSLVMAIALCFYLTACGGDNKPTSKSATAQQAAPNINITEVAPPSEIQRLSRLLDRYAPQISIISPKPDQVLNDTQVSVKFDVKNLPIFKNAEFGLGPHIHVTLDNQEYKALYDLNQTVTFDNLSAGTHTIRAFASRPWHESFKNQGAYAQATFHVLTKTGENTPEAKTPLLTYSRPVGTYGAEPILLDFYLQNAPLHVIGKDDEMIDDWQVRATVDGQSFTFDRWEPIYLKGFKTGQNWVKLELLEPDGDAIANVFNSTAHLINYQPNGTDTLARLVRGEKIANIDAIVNPDYVPPTPTPTPVVTATPAAVESVTPVVAPKPTETPKTEVASPTSTPVAAPKEEPKSVDKASSVIPVVPVVPVPVAPVITSPITEPVKVTPIKVKAAPVEPIKVAPVPIKVLPVKEPVKATPVEVKTAPVVTPIKVTPVPIKVVPVKEPVKVTPIKVQSTPVVVEPAKPVQVKVQTTPVPEPVKNSPVPIRRRFTPVVEPAKPIAPKVVTTPASPKESASAKEVTQVTPKVEPSKDAIPEKVPNAIAPASPTDYFKNLGLNARKFFSNKSDSTKSVEKTEEKAKDLGTDSTSSPEAKSESKTTVNPPALTDLSSTTTAPIKVLNNK